MSRVAISAGSGLVLAVMLALAATYTDSSVAAAVVRPFALLGFVVVNQHQGSVAFSIAAMFVVFTIAIWVLLASVNALRRQR
jgi:uncharacterized membrane protein YccC